MVVWIVALTQVDASIDDGSCFYNGCMDTLAVNFESYVTMDDGSVYNKS